MLVFWNLDIIVRNAYQWALTCNSKQEDEEEVRGERRRGEVDYGDDSCNDEAHPIVGHDVRHVKFTLRGYCV
jgi:hypothetical protein